MRIIFLGTADFAVPALKALAGEKDFEIVSVLTRPDRRAGRGQKVCFNPVKQAALELDLPVYQPEDIREPDAVSFMESLQPDILAVVAYGQILNRKVLGIPRLAAVNLHGSLLPAYRGAAPVHRAVMDGQTRAGVCTMHMAPKLDAGDVIFCEETPVPPEMTAGELYDNLAGLGGPLLVRTLQEIGAGKAPRTPQREEEATYAPMLTHEDRQVDWNLPAKVIRNRIRGLYPWPGAYTFFRGERMALASATVLEEDSGLPPGTVVSADCHTGLVVACGEKTLLVERIRPAGKKEMMCQAWLNGASIEPGDRFDVKEE